MKSIFTNIMLTLLFCTLVSSTSFGQSKLIQIKGRVTDETGAGMPGVTVSVKGKSMAINYDNSGGYGLVKVAEKEILLFSIVCYTPKEIVIILTNTIDVILSPDSKNLKEVIV